MNMRDELPEGWVLTRVDELLEPGGLFDGPFGSSLKTADYTKSGVRVIRLENLANLRFVADKETFISEQKYQALKKHTVSQGDILVGSFVDGAVRVCLLPELPTRAIAKADCFTVRTRVEIALRKFVALQLGWVKVAESFVTDIHGATRPRITTKQLRECTLAMPPLAEQQRIVERVDMLFAQVDALATRVDRLCRIIGGADIPATKTDRLRQAILTKAFAGELVPTESAIARSEGRSYETIAQLLTRDALAGARGSSNTRSRRASRTSKTA